MMAGEHDATCTAARKVAMAAVRWLASDGDDDKFDDLERLVTAFMNTITEVH